MKNLRAASVQSHRVPGDESFNAAKVCSFVERAAEKGVELIASPEMCIAGYRHVRNLRRE